MQKLPDLRRCVDACGSDAPSANADTFVLESGMRPSTSWRMPSSLRWRSEETRYGERPFCSKKASQTCWWNRTIACSPPCRTAAITADVGCLGRKFTIKRTQRAQIPTRTSFSTT
eukprot:3017077-Rhodomonas_salina.1